MGLLGDIAYLFGFNDGPSKPSQQDLEDAQIVDEFIREDGEGEQFFEEGDEYYPFFQSWI